MNQKKLIKFIKSECKRHEIKLNLRRGKYVQCEKGMKTSGFFDSENKSLVCAIKNPNFLTILAHEYCHLTQWKDNCKVWSDCDKYDIEILSDWITGKNFDNKRLIKAIKASINLEFDNEKRTVKLLKKFGMSSEKIDLYIQKSNAYILFYLHLLETRKWYKPSNAPYENVNVILSMSKKFNMNYNKLSDKVRNIFITENI